MRKVQLIIFLLLLSAPYYLQAQKIKVEQYTILVEQHVERSVFGTCYTYVNNHPSNAVGCIPDDYPGPYAGLCMIEDVNCQTCGGNPQGFMDAVFFKMRRTDGTTTVFLDAKLGQMQAGEQKVFLDTIHLMEPLNLDVFETEVIENTVYSPGEIWYEENFDTYCHPFSVKSYGGMYNSEVIPYNVVSYNGRYFITTNVRIVPNLDQTYNLPSHDKITLQIAGGDVQNPVWQFLDPRDGAYKDISSVHTLEGGKLLKISGYDLLGPDYETYLHSTITFRVRSGNWSFISDVAPFTLRLSSPHITGVSSPNVECYGSNQGSMKINFDRALLPGEKLNILVMDTVHKISYSQLNLTSLQSDNGFVWPHELKAGTFSVSLIGKYAKGLTSDLTVYARGADAQYLALNSVNFEDGFDSRATDDFEAYTDYSSLSYATYTGAINHIGYTDIWQPEEIHFNGTVQNNVLCKGSATGSVLLKANGGWEDVQVIGGTVLIIKTNYKYSLKREGDADYSPWVNFNNHDVSWITIDNASANGTAELISNLKAGKYSLRIRDNKDCFAKDHDGNEIIHTFTITEPEKGITLDLFEVSPITAYNAANAKVKVQISGGTPFVTTPEVAHDPYIVTFTNKLTNEQIQLTNTILEANKRMEAVTGLLGEGDYILRIHDAYYATNTADPGGCLFEMEIPIRKPEELLVTIREKRPVSCYDSTDGRMAADATGGIKIDHVNYTFKWYKVTNGVNTLAGTDSLVDAAAGTYFVEVTDKYNNTKTSQTFGLTQPSPMLLNPTSLPTNCYSDSNGVLQVTVTGGTPYSDGSYKYEWSTGARTPVVNKVLGGDYVIVVTDSMFCMARGTVSVTSPVRILPNAGVTQNTCRNKCDGRIALSPTGGQGVYTYSWSTGATTSAISNLCPGTYWYKVTDIGGCSESDTVVLTNPDTLFVNIGADRKICIGQTIKLDATASDTAVLTYNWQSDNGFTANTAKVAVVQSSTYRVAVTNSRGCVVHDTVVISAQNSSINTEFIVSTQAFINESVTLVNLSQPRTDSVKWLLPSAGNVVRPLLETNDKCELIFSDTGRYAITMQAYYASGCIDDTTKSVVVLNRSGSVTGGGQSDAYLKAAVIYPNPNNGMFNVDLNFSETTRARLRFINSLTNVIVDDRLIQGQKDYHLDYNTGVLNSGVYMLVIDAAKGSFVYKVIIAH
jgi:hypothetical protein